MTVLLVAWSFQSRDVRCKDAFSYWYANTCEAKTVRDLNKRKSNQETYTDQDQDGGSAEAWPQFTPPSLIPGTELHRSSDSLMVRLSCCPSGFIIWPPPPPPCWHFSLCILQRGVGECKHDGYNTLRQNRLMIHEVSFASLKMWVLCGLPVSQTTLNVVLWVQAAAFLGLPTPKIRKCLVVHKP